MIGHELFANMAKLDHMIYKNNAYSSVFENKVNKGLNDHTACNLGKWYEDDGKKQFANSESFKSIEKPHKHVHKNITQVMKILENEDISTNSGEIIKLFKEIEIDSHVLFGYLDKVIEK